MCAFSQLAWVNSVAPQMGKRKSASSGPWINARGLSKCRRLNSPVSAFHVHDIVRVRQPFTTMGTKFDYNECVHPVSAAKSVKRSKSCVPLVLLTACLKHASSNSSFDNGVIIVLCDMQLGFSDRSST